MTVFSPKVGFVS